MVEKLTAAGLNADAVAQVLNVNKNRLRAEHALALTNGRATLKKQKAEAAAAALTSEEKFALDAILEAFDGWDEPDGNLLWSGVNGDGATSPADAFARWMLDGGKFICTGLDDNFSRDRLEEFAQVKAAAKKLLKTRQ